MGRVICEYSENRPGPLLVVFGAMHGNEPAGVEALKALQHLLLLEPHGNPDFKFQGKILGLIGNLRAYEQQKRFINKDLNRIWTKDRLDTLDSRREEDLISEEIEMKEILKMVKNEIETHDYSHVYILDIHTTSAKGGIFSIVTDQDDSMELGFKLHAPVVKGMLDNLAGTSMHYFHPENFDIPVTAVSFEAGQHYEPLSAARALAAIINILRSTKQVAESDVETKHDNILQEYSKDLPKILQLLKTHVVNENDEFSMLPGFQNFQEITRGQEIAKDKQGMIVALEDGMILMPLYQEQGVDGFFLVRDISNSY